MKGDVFYIGNYLLTDLIEDSFVDYLNLIKNTKLNLIRKPDF